jgi:hypothetical protein
LLVTTNENLGKREGRVQLLDLDVFENFQEDLLFISQPVLASGVSENWPVVHGGL